MTMAAPLPVNLLCGYLGAGKTTLLNRLLDRQGERILVMVNDFGDIAVDAALIAGRSADTIQLSNGCICCSIGGGLFDAFERALSLRNRVDRLVIEASGVAEPRRGVSRLRGMRRVGRYPGWPVQHGIWRQRR